MAKQVKVSAVRERTGAWSARLPRGSRAQRARSADVIERLVGGRCRTS
ncbi:hypothetical protein [Acrocarpospora sp. B8E8]